jgi:hypothetical protein
LIKYIYFQILKKNWKDAKSFCEERGLQLAKMDSEREMKLVSNATPDKTSEYFWSDGESVHCTKCVQFQGITGWERPMSDSSRDNSTGQTGRRWTGPSGTVANQMITAKEKKLASFCTMRNFSTIRALIHGILCAKWAKSLKNVSERNYFTSVREILI